MTKSDTSRQELSIQQSNAIDLLAAGGNDRTVADAVGVSRQTVCSWRLHNSMFTAKLNERRIEIWSSAADKLRSLIDKALDVVETQLNAGDTSVALSLLKLSSREGLLDPRSIGSTNPDRVLFERYMEYTSTPKLHSKPEIQSEPLHVPVDKTGTLV